MITLTALDDAALPALQALRQAQQAPWPVPDLRGEFYSAARDHGLNVRIAWRSREAVGCVAWVELGIAQAGDFYISPLVASDELVAATLLEPVIDRARAAGAKRVRVSAAASEPHKIAVLERAGFEPALEWISFARLVTPCIAPAFAALGLHVVVYGELDWAAVARLYADTFRDVPHTPVLSAEQLRHDWAAADRDASCVLADARGELVAFVVMAANGEVDCIGVQAHLRGKADSPAGALYQHVQSRLALRQVPQMTAFIASTNVASVRFHQKKGFEENKPRATAYVYEFEVAADIALMAPDQSDSI